MQNYKEKILAMANEACKNTLMETLNIEVIDCGEDFIVARMPVNSRVHQPDGVLHGGATVALAETVGSFASLIFNKQKDVFVRGIEITGNHLKGVREGFVYAKAKALHNGRTTQLWDIKITDDNDVLVSVCKLTTIALPKKQ
ncbi:PaaI family thioesterase [Mangrovimonas aestuarii]|uniref:PaaI family thioesterase n=1 Tax=Mangrovimonas aestuarii TaxID=3018443 RepID=UPI002379068C|nr:PaaI family thioesterase [Mangrovimonas aestuarii]